MDAKLKLALITLLGCAVLPSRAAAETRPAYGGSIKASLLGEPVIIDPVQANNHAELTLVSLIFDTLYRIGDKSRNGAPTLIPHVASALPEVSSDGLEARVPVRSGITFHGGRLLTAKDAARSLQRLRASPKGWLLAPVESLRIVRAKARGDRRQEQADGYVLVFQLSRAAPELALLLSAPSTAITPGGQAPKTHRTGRVSGSGPFRLTRLNRTSRRARLVASTGHFAGRPYVDEIILRWFETADQEATIYESGRAHMSLRGAVAFAGHKPAYRTRELAGSATLLSYVGLGKTRAHGAITRNRNFRRALSLALDRNGFRGVGTGERVMPTIHPVPVALGGKATSTAARRAQLATAKSNLAEAATSVPLLAGTQRVELELIIDRTRPDDREIAEKVIAALFRLGIGARISAIPAKTFRERVGRGDCDLYIGQLVIPVPAKGIAMAAAFAAGNDKWATEELASGSLDADGASRAFARRLPIIPLFHRALRVHHRSDVRGLRLGDNATLSLDDLFLFGPAEKSR